VHRALLAVSVPAALWIVAALEEAAGARSAVDPACTATAAHERRSPGVASGVE
jgi:hypothetical protein